jgi:hypothetical protein
MAIEQQRIDRHHMTQATDTDIRELKDLITGLRAETRLGFANIDTKFANIDTKLGDIKGDLKVIDSRLTIVEATLTKLDNRLWTFIGLVLTSTLGTLLAVFVRYMFWDNPKL